MVADDGTPSLVDQKSFFVVVRDTLSDFALSLGTTNLLAGQSTSVPIVLRAGADVIHVAFDLIATDQHLGNFALEPLGGELQSATLEPAGDGRFHVRLDFDQNQAQSGSRPIALLHFETEPSGHSSIAHLVIERLVGVRQDGENLVHTSAQEGRVFVVEVEPLLDALQNPPRMRLTLFGVPGTVSMLQSGHSLDSSGWSDEEPIRFSGSPQAVERDLSAAVSTFYRLQLGRKD